MTLKLNVIVGSTRPGRNGPVVAKWFNEFANAHGKFDADLVDLAGFDLPLLDEPAHPRLKDYAHEHTKRWSESVENADAFAFVTPEFDFFPPASLINAIQFLFSEWRYKPAMVVSYGGVSGGLRSAQELRLLLANMGVMPIPQSVPMPFYAKCIGDDETFMPTEPMSEGSTLALDELYKWAEALKPMRG